MHITKIACHPGLFYTILIFIFRLFSGFSGKIRGRTQVQPLVGNVYLASLEDRYLRTISATLNTMAWSNCRRSRPVSFLIFSRR